MSVNVNGRRKVSVNALNGVLEDARVRRTGVEGEVWYAVEDLVGVLAESAHAGELWADLKGREGALANVVERLEVPEGSGEVVECVSLEGALRVVQAVPSAKAERVKLWVAAAAREQFEEMANPELTWVRLQKNYGQRGYANGWVQKRLRGMSARQELVREWARRGVSESEQYRVLTNTIMEAAFGMDVLSYRRFKHLDRPSEGLRDHMTDLELTLTTLGETAAAALHRAHGSQGFEQLLGDVRDAGEITRVAREEMERRGGTRVVSAA